MRPGYWSDLRYARAKLKADSCHLANAPLGPIQKKRMTEQVEMDRKRVKDLLAEGRKR